MSREYDRILIRPSEEWAEKIREYRQECLAADGRMDGTGTLKTEADPYRYIEACRREENRETVRRGMVPATQFLYVSPKTEQLIGMISVRHELNDALKRLGGHIGYSIRPSMRGRREAPAMLDLALAFCRKELGLTSVMVSCHADNPASEHTILSCGGVRVRDSIDPENGTAVHIFEICL